MGKQSAHLLLALGGLETTNVELKLLALKDVTVAATGLTRARRDGGVETTGTELLLNEGVELGVLAAVLELAGDMGRELGLVDVGLGGTLTSGTALGGHGLAVVLLVSLAEGSSVDLDDGTLYEGVGADKFVVGCVVDLDGH